MEVYGYLTKSRVCTGLVFQQRSFQLGINMDYAVHYAALGLQYGADEKAIKKAYFSKALRTHPDKRHNDPDAHAIWLKLQESYDILKQKILEDNSVLVKRAKRQRPMSDVEKREHEKRAKAEDDERIARTLQEEITRIRSQFSKKAHDDVPPSKKSRSTNEGSNLGKGTSLDREKVLNVSWEKTGVDYGVERLKDIFSNFGIVEYVVMKRSNKKGSANVVMATRDAAVAATRNVLGDISNPLLVLPLPPTQSTADNLRNLGHEAFENSVLEKMKKEA